MRFRLLPVSSLAMPRVSSRDIPLLAAGKDSPVVFATSCNVVTTLAFRTSCTRNAEPAAAVPAEPAGARVTIHWLSVVIFAIAVAAAPWWGQRLRSWPLRFGVVLMALVLSWSTWGIASTELALPWRGQQELPDDADDNRDEQ